MGIAAPLLLNLPLRDQGAGCAGARPAGGAGAPSSVVPLRTSSEAPGDRGSISRLDRITSHPEICHGQPVVRGLRYPVQTLFELLSSGMPFDELLADYEDLEREDLLAALEYGALTVGGQRVQIR